MMIAVSQAMPFEHRLRKKDASLKKQLSRDQNPPYLEGTGAFRSKVWRKQSVVFREVS